jgi:hypothetical protein
MEKKTIFLELPAEMIDRIDRSNVMGDRSAFISDLLSKQLENNVSTMNVNTELTSHMEETAGSLGVTGEIKLVDKGNLTLGSFNINTEEGLNDLIKKIGEITEDPLVRIKARLWG